MLPALPIGSKGDDGDLPGDESQTSVAEARRCQQRAFERAAQAVAGRDRSGAGDPASFGVEIGNLEGWARETGALIPWARAEKFFSSMARSRYCSICRDEQRHWRFMSP